MTSRAVAAAFAFLSVTVSAHADSGATGNMFYQSCMAAADIMERHHPSDEQFEKAPMCLGAVTAIMNLEPFLKSEFAMCPPKGSKISYGQMILVISDYLKKHPEQLHENFHMLAVLALNTAWPCVTER
jgi:hypothetical protein